jgi:soluble lytic murein transglycosylase
MKPIPLPAPSAASILAILVTVAWAQAGEIPTDLTVSKVVEKKISGMDFLTAENAAKLKKQAQEFINFKRGRMAGSRKLVWVAGCLFRPDGNPFCNYMIRAKKGARADESSPSDPKAERDAGVVSDLMARADIAKLKTYSEMAYHKALRLYPAFRPLEKLAAAAIAAKDCPSVALLTSLGQKAEEFLPDKDHLRIAQSLFSKADTCGSGDAADKARFRLSLLYIFDGACRKAEPYLIKLSETPDGDYVSRALYWRSYCADQSGDDETAEAMKARLFKENPLSYHALVLAGSKSKNIAVPFMNKDPVVALRSGDAGVDQVLEAAEVLTALKAPDLAGELLDNAGLKLESARLPVRLYAAILMGRVDERISQFKLLTSAFREDEATVSESTLRLFYPLERFEVLKSLRAVVDPYLIAAVIRQESGFHEKARSAAGALGMMQLMPEVASRMERVSKRELLDAKTNIRLGVKYFRFLLNRYNQDAELALAAYNAGPERVDEWRRRYKTRNRMLLLDMIPFKETRDYVALIARNYFWYINLYGGRRDAVHPPQKARPLVFTLFSVPQF